MALLATSDDTAAQQDPMYTQYIDNLLIINPGFAGSKGTGNFLLVARNQWVSFDGAPVTKSFSYHSPIKGFKAGVGFSLLTDKIGPLEQTGLYFDYSYFLNVGRKYMLGMGLKGGFSFYRASLTELITIDPDPIYEEDIYKNFLPNFGVGIFLFSNNTYLGFSLPKLLKNDITREDFVTDYIGREELHMYFVAGKKFLLGENLQLKTNSMLKYVHNAPISLDVTAMIGLKGKFWVGGMLRFKDSFGLLTQYNVTDYLLLGYSYDLAFSELNSFNNGTHEIMVGYNFNLFSRKRQTPLQRENLWY